MRQATIASQSGGTRRSGPVGLGIGRMVAQQPLDRLQSPAELPTGEGGDQNAMTMTSMFDDIIQDHLRLKEQNAELERYMPIDRYKGVDPFENHPLFKTEEQARIEDTLDGNVSIAEPEEDLVVAHAQAYGIEPAPADEGLWSRSRDFDWGD